MAYCKNCGNEIEDNAKFCSVCGASQKDDANSSNGENESLITIIKVFAIITCIFSGFAFLIPLAWTIPMTISLCRKLDKHEYISVGFKVCILLFQSLLTGILVLVLPEKY